MSESNLTDQEREKLEDIANSDEDWADAIAAYLAAIDEVEGNNKPFKQEESDYVEETNTSSDKKQESGISWGE